MDDVITISIIVAATLGIALVCYALIHSAKTRKAAAENKLSLIFNTFDSGICLYNIGTMKFEECNSVMLNMFGYNDKNGLSNVSLKKIFGNTVANSIQSVGDKTVVHEVLTSKRTKEMFWARVSLKKVSCLGSTYIIFTVNNIDNTLPKENSPETDYKQLLNEFVAAKKMTLWTFNLQTQRFDIEIGNPIWNNTTFERVCKMVSLDDVERFRKIFTDLQNGIIVDKIFTLNIIESVTGNQLLCEVTVALFKDVNGKICKIYGTLRNVSEENGNRELSDYKRNIQSLMHDIDVIQFDYDCRSKNIFVEAEGKCETMPIEKYKLRVHPENSAEADNVMVEMEQCKNVNFKFEALFRNVFGLQYCWCNLVCKPLAFNSDGKVSKYIGFLHNADKFHNKQGISKDASAIPTASHSHKITDDSKLVAMVVGDEATVVQFRQSDMAEDYEVHYCADIVQVMSLLENTTPNAAIVDLAMQGDDGLAISNCIKSKLPETVLAVLCPQTSLDNARQNSTFDIVAENSCDITVLQKSITDSISVQKRPASTPLADKKTKNL